MTDKIQPRFDIGDVVYYLVNDSVCRFVCAYIRIGKTKDKYVYNYFDDKHRSYPDYACYASADDAFNSDPIQ